MNGLHVDGVLKNYGVNQVLTDIFITCKKGEIVGLLGRNGTGKSTLLKVIFGSIEADRKFVKVGDKVIAGLFDSRYLINYMPQDSWLPNHVNVSTIIKLFCDQQQAKTISENKFVRPLLKKKSKQLSSGEKRVLELFLMLYSKAEFVLIDEPFNGIAPVFKEEIIRLIKEQSTVKGFIITDHDYYNILKVAGRVILLHDGGTKEINNKKELEQWGYLPEEKKYD